MIWGREVGLLRSQIEKKRDLPTGSKHRLGEYPSCCLHRRKARRALRGSKVTVEYLLIVLPASSDPSSGPLGH